MNQNKCKIKFLIDINKLKQIKKEKKIEIERIILD